MKRSYGQHCSLTELRLARKLWGRLPRATLDRLAVLMNDHALQVSAGDLILLDGRWYITHTGLIRLARRNGCAGIHVRPVPTFCDASRQRWAFEANVYKTCSCRGFVGYGDADPSNVSPLVHGPNSG